MTSNRADLGKDPQTVSGMFDAVAARYDLTNIAMTFGLDAAWRRATTRAVDPKPGERILDLAAGTCRSSAALARGGAEVVAADFSAGMLAQGQKRFGDMRGLSFALADAMDLPFGDAEFDAVTMSYGLRNVQQPKVALAELLRVTKPGGRIVINEFSTPPNATFRALYRWYNAQVLPRIARVASSNGDAYDYLNESIRDWPAQRELAAWMREAGWTAVAHRNLTGGIVALHRATRPVAA
ncbi:class I SAM-dependent methyltransferase [Microbacterium gubbeenense]|uniref:class I SAM-dependent methyltransferase n=1 Tax=Microbacterium gubbeenense TaxID=159896 RepID=UPI003F9D4B53